MFSRHLQTTKGKLDRIMIWNEFDLFLMKSPKRWKGIRHLCIFFLLLQHVLQLHDSLALLSMPPSCRTDKLVCICAVMQISIHTSADTFANNSRKVYYGQAILLKNGGGGNSSTFLSQNCLCYFQLPVKKQHSFGLVQKLFTQRKNLAEKFPPSKFFENSCTWINLQ